MSHAIQYHPEESDSEGNGYSGDEGIVFTESKRMMEEKHSNSNGQVPKVRARATKHDLEGQPGSLDGVKLKKRRRTIEVNDLPLHDEEDLVMTAEVPLKFKSRIWNEAMVSVKIYIYISVIY